MKTIRHYLKHNKIHQYHTQSIVSVHVKCKRIVFMAGLIYK